MSFQNNSILAKFGIDEIYINNKLSDSMLEKLHQRAAFSFDAEDKIIEKLASHDMVLIFNKKVPSQSVIYRFLEYLDQFVDKEDFIKSNTFLKEEEEDLFSTIKLKNFVLITRKILFKEEYRRV